MADMSEVITLFRIEQEIKRALSEARFETALQLYNQAIIIKTKISNTLGLAKTIAEKGYLLEQHGFSQEALLEYQRAFQMVEKSPNRQFVDIIHQRMTGLSSGG